MDPLAPVLVTTIVACIVVIVFTVLRLALVVWFNFDVVYWLGFQLFRIKIWLRPNTVTPHLIKILGDDLYRDAAMQRFGLEQYIKETNMLPCDNDPLFGSLYRFSFPTDVYTVLRVSNSTPEKDGTVKNHYIRVDNRIYTAHEAVAWTFGLPQNEYFPWIET